MHAKLHHVAHAPLLSCNLISLPYLALKGHTYAGDKDYATLKLKGGETVHFPLIRERCSQYGYRPKAKGRVVYTSGALNASRQAKAPATPTAINTFHCTYGHTHKVLLKKMAEQQDVNLSGELHECRGSSMAKGLRKPIARSTHTRAGTLCPSRAPYCRRGGAYNEGGREWRGRVKAKWREYERLGQRVQPRHDGGVTSGATLNARGASGRTWIRGPGPRGRGRQHTDTIGLPWEGRFRWYRR